MKKWLPLILFVLGLLVFVGVYFFVIKGKKGVEEIEEEASVPPIPLEQRPVASLTPSEDGHWLVLEITDIKIEAASLDYELLYKVEDGRTQGVPGSIMLDGQSGIERELLLGSESSGKFRYDEGVESGTLTLRFRNEKGKLVGKLSTQFHLQSAERELTSLDGKFSYTLNKTAKGVWFVTMETFGLPDNAPGSLSAGPYGIFASEDGPYAGEVDGATHVWSGSAWQELEDNESTDIGIFCSFSE